MIAADGALSAAQARRRRPPAPVPEEREFGRLELLLRLRRNPLTIWRTRHFREPIVAGEGLFGYGVVISIPTRSGTSWSRTPRITARTTCSAPFWRRDWARAC